VKETWERHRNGFAFITYSIALVITPALAAGEAESLLARLIFITWMLLGAFVTSVMLSVFIEMEVDKRLKEKQ
jgi:hypothetical protein